MRLLPLSRPSRGRHGSGPTGRTRAALRGTAAACAGLMLSFAVLAVPAAASDEHSDLAGQYGSLSGALLNFYAAQSNTSLSDYLQQRDLLIAPVDMSERLQMPPATAGPSAAGATGTAEALPVDPSADPAAGPGVGSAGGPTPSGLPSDPAALPTAALPDAAVPGSAEVSRTPLLLTRSQAAELGVEGSSISASSLGELNSELSKAGLTVSTTGFDSLSALAAGVQANSETPDGAVILAGAQWVSELGRLHTPELARPNAPAPDAPGIPQDALPFGLLMNRSLTAMVTDHPDMFADARTSGLGKQALADAWKQSMSKAFLSSQADFSKVVPDPCTAGMMAVMATGDPASAARADADCSTNCAAGGQYLHNQMSDLFDRRYALLAPGDSSAGPIKHEEFEYRFPAWMLNSWVEGDFDSARQFAPPEERGPWEPMRPDEAATSCGAANTAATDSLSRTMPGVFSSLR